MNILYNVFAFYTSVFWHSSRVLSSQLPPREKKLTDVYMDHRLEGKHKTLRQNTIKVRADSPFKNLCPSMFVANCSISSDSLSWRVQFSVVAAESEPQTQRNWTNWIRKRTVLRTALKHLELISKNVAQVANKYNGQYHTTHRLYIILMKQRLFSW